MSTWFKRARNAVVVAGMVAVIAAVLGGAYLYKQTVDGQRTRVEENERARLASERNAAEFERCHGEALRQARLFDQRRHEEAARSKMPQHHQGTQEESLWEMWRAGGRTCKEPTRPAATVDAPLTPEERKTLCNKFIPEC